MLSANVRSKVYKGAANVKHGRAYCAYIPLYSEVLKAVQGSYPLCRMLVDRQIFSDREAYFAAW